jgi:hypothetical protein
LRFPATTKNPAIPKRWRGFVCKRQNPSEYAKQLDLELALYRHETGFFDQAAQRCGRFLAKLGAVQ